MEEPATETCLLELYTIRFFLEKKYHGLTSHPVETRESKGEDRADHTVHSIMMSEIREKVLDNRRQQNIRSMNYSNLVQITKKIFMKKQIGKLETQTTHRLNAMLIIKGINGFLGSLKNRGKSEMTEYITDRGIQQIETNSKRESDVYSKVKKLLMRHNFKELQNEFAQLKSVNSGPMCVKSSLEGNSLSINSINEFLTKTDSENDLKIISPLSQRDLLTSKEMIVRNKSVNQQQPLSRDTRTKELIKPYFELNSDFGHFESFYSNNLKLGLIENQNYESLSFYFPNFKILNDLVSPGKEGLVESSSSQTKISDVSFQSLLEMLSSKINGESFNKLLSTQMSPEITTILHHFKNTQSLCLCFWKLSSLSIIIIDSITHDFFNSIPELLKTNVNLLSFLGYHLEYLGFNMELIMNMIVTIPIFKNFQITYDMLLRLLVWNEYIKGKRVVEITGNYKVSNSKLLMETGKFSNQMPSGDLGHFFSLVREKERVFSSLTANKQFLEFYGNSKEVEVRSIFSRDNTLLNVKLMKQSGTTKSTTKENPAPESVFAKALNSSFEWESIKKMTDKPQKFDYKKLLNFKKTLNQGELTRISQVSYRGQEQE